ncbi:hypothetical protein [Streptomyces sp. NPDC126514]|uniref:hypothetical protein n=1 Tax=Streptomyces sp. NPDC126514 TaxID=3155210 RepID=UPI00331FA2BB
MEADSAGARKASWLYCWDQAGNLTAQNGSATGWSYDKAGNETSGGRTATARRTSETWTWSLPRP